MDAQSELASSPTLGLERRLVRRAEAVWSHLCKDEKLPRLGDASLLLQAPFGNQSALVTRDPGFRDSASLHDGAGLRLSYVGGRLAQLGIDSPGPLDELTDPGARLFTALVAEALETGSTAHLASEDMESGIIARPGGPALLLRAVALPFAGAEPADGNSAVAAIVIASWREFLSEGDTRALHAELARAVRRIAPV